MQWLMEQTSQIDVVEERATAALLGEEEGDEAARRKGSQLGKGGDEGLLASASKASSPLVRSASLLSTRLSSRFGSFHV